MLLITCPYCQEARSEEEFSYAGEAHRARPASPEALSDAEWADYLHFRSNPLGPHREMWVHTAGCRRYFNVLRDTATYKILKSYPIGESAPDPPAHPPGKEGILPSASTPAPESGKEGTRHALVEPSAGTPAPEPPDWAGRQ